MRPLHPSTVWVDIPFAVDALGIETTSAIWRGDIGEHVFGDDGGVLVWSFADRRTARDTVERPLRVPAGRWGFKEGSDPVTPAEIESRSRVGYSDRVPACLIPGEPPLRHRPAH